MNSESQELLSDLRRRLLSLCSQFRHANNELEKANVREEMATILRAIVHTEEQIKNECSGAEGDSFCDQRLSTG
jgi:hypothetical protein